MMEKESSKNNNVLNINKSYNVSQSKRSESLFDSESNKVSNASRKRRNFRKKTSKKSSFGALIISNEMISSENKNSENDNIENVSQKNTYGDIFQKSENSRLKTSRGSKKKREDLNSTLDNIQNNSKSSDNLNIQENEDGDLTFRQRLTLFFELNDRLLHIKVIIAILNLLSYVYYIICTYKRSLFPSLNTIDLIMCSLLIAEHLINFLLAHHLILYLFSIESLVFFIIEIPPFFCFACKNFDTDSLYRFINITRSLRPIKSYRIIDLLQREKSVKNQIMNIILILLLITFVFAGMIQMLDMATVQNRLRTTFDLKNENVLSLRKNFHHYVYFIIESLTTVGYGEVVPLTILSEWIIIFLVVVILVVVPDQTNELINLSNAQTIYERKEYISSDDVPFVVLIGNIGLDALKSFCGEFFHKDHGKHYRHIVILMNKFPDKATELFLNEKENSKFIFYLQGDPMKNDDLLRADIIKAKSCIIFSNKNARDPYSEDQKTLLLAIFVKKYYFLTMLEKYAIELSNLNKINFTKPGNKLIKPNNFRVCLQLNKPDSCPHFYNTLQSIYKKNMSTDQLLVIETLKMNLLSKSCLTPGIIALLSNLVSSSSGTLPKSEPEWIREYSEGQQYEIYKFTAEDELLNYSFQQLTIEIYNKFHSILLALEIIYNGGTLIKLNPQNENVCTINEMIENVYMKFNKNGKDDFYSLSFDDENDNTNNKNDVEESYIDDDDIKHIQRLKFLKFKKLMKVSFYLISGDKEIIDEIVKMDTIKNGNDTSYDNSLIESNTKKKQPKSLTENTKPQKTQNKKLLRFASKFIDEKSISDFSTLSDDEEENEGYFFEGTQKFHDYEKIADNYYTLEGAEKNYLYTNEIMRQGIKDRNDIQHHVIICGMHPEIIHFILPLRSKCLTENLLKWIVILAPSLPQEIHDTLSIFPKVIFIQGDPLHPENLFRANITTADIAVILSSTFNNSSKIFDFNTFSDDNNEDDDFNYDENNGKKNDGKNKLDDEMLDSTTLFIYKTIKKINHSIQIITELLVTKNIEFLLSSKYLKKLYERSNQNYYNKMSETEYNETQNNNNNTDISPYYEHTPLYAAGEIYLPSIVDKITGQMYFNSNLLTILKLILGGEKPPLKKSDKKLAQAFNLNGANLFLIPCEPRNESFSEMFKRLLSKNGMISIALYRKNITDNFYYVYTNPRKTTLMRETDYVFVLACAENMSSLYGKNLVNISEQEEEENLISEPLIEPTNTKTTFFKVLQDSIQKQILSDQSKNDDKSKNDFSNKTSNKNLDTNSNSNNNNQEKKKFNFLDLVNNMVNKPDNKEEEKKDEDYKNSLRAQLKEQNDKDNLHLKEKYAEIDALQNKLDASIEKLKLINSKCKDIKREMDSFIKDEISNELLIYINNIPKKK